MKIWLYSFTFSDKIGSQNLHRKIMTIIMLNILIANASDSYAITILEGPVGENICSSRICAIKSIHKIPLSQNTYVLIAKSLSRPCLGHKQT